MPERHWIEELPRHAGQTVSVRVGRDHPLERKIAFVVVRDGTGYLQAVISKKDVSPEVWTRSGKLTQETSLRVDGQRAGGRARPGGAWPRTSGCSAWSRSASRPAARPRSPTPGSSATTTPSGAPSRAPGEAHRSGPAPRLRPRARAEGRAAEAAEAASELLRLAPKHLDALWELAGAEVALAKDESAIATLERALLIPEAPRGSRPGRRARPAPRRRSRGREAIRRRPPLLPARPRASCPTIRSGRSRSRAAPTRSADHSTRSTRSART